MPVSFTTLPSGAARPHPDCGRHCSRYDQRCTVRVREDSSRVRRPEFWRRRSRPAESLPALSARTRLKCAPLPASRTPGEGRSRRPAPAGSCSMLFSSFRPPKARRLDRPPLPRRKRAITPPLESLRQSDRLAEIHFPVRHAAARLADELRRVHKRPDLLHVKIARAARQRAHLLRPANLRFLRHSPVSHK